MNPACWVAMMTEFCRVVPNICGASVWNLLLVTLLLPRILMAPRCFENFSTLVLKSM